MNNLLRRPKSAGGPEDAPASSHEINFQGIPVVIEYPEGSTREGVDAQGNPWQREMHASYGYIPDTVGKGDNEALDCYVGEDETAPNAYVIEQLKEDGSFDEYKVMLGFDDPGQALTTYKAHFPKEWEYDRIGDIWPMPVNRLAELVEEERGAAEQQPDPLEKEAAPKAPAKKAPAKKAPEKKQRIKYPPKPEGYRKLLEEENAKTIKGEKLGYLTGILYLAPAREAGGRDMCPGRSEECTQGCLYDAGMASVFPTIKAARIAKTKFFFENPKAFMDSLRWDVQALELRAEKEGLTPAVRINGTSDVPKLAQTMAKEFPHIQFYDYTKLAKPYQRTMPNYDLTFSRSEDNEEHVKDALAHGINVAAVFNVKPGKPLPTEFLGHRVIDGDEHDLRFLDEKDPDGKAVIVGLRAKGPAKKMDAGSNNFVVKVEDLGKGTVALSNN